LGKAFPVGLPRRQRYNELVRRTKIVCTLGPASDTPELIDRLIAAGLDCARLNFSHGDHASHRAMAEKVRAASKRAQRPVAILADLCGPKMRIGTFPAGPIQLEPGAEFTLTTRKVPGDANQVSITYALLPRDVQPGDHVLLDDGLLRLEVTGTTETDVRTRVVEGGALSDRKGLNVPGAGLSAPALTDKDKVDLAFAVDELRVDYVALSFVRSAADVREAQALAKGTPVIAKIEKPEAIRELGAIADQADGIMVARGDLGVELGSEKVPLIQKRIIRETNLRGKLVITATQMLDSMIRNPRPTRAEAADVANAVMDGTDAVMLSGETASGSYPVESVMMMNAIITEVERESLETLSRQVREVKVVANADWSFPESAARAAAVLCTHIPLKAVVSFTKDGVSAMLLSEHRPKSPIVAITEDPRVARRLALGWGIIPRLEVPPETLEETLRIASSVLAREGLCRTGESFAMVFAWPLSGGTNSVKLHTL
jgi:pyruvate kinase